jgi:hypothetical protein
MRSILDIAQARPGVTSGGRLLARVLGKGDIADPAAIWRAVPEARAQFTQSAAEGRLYRNVATARPPQQRR